MSTHLFPAHVTYRNNHDSPESFLTGAAAILGVLVILIALAVAVAAVFGAVMATFTRQIRLECSWFPPALV